MDAGRNHIQSSMTMGWKCRRHPGRVLVVRGRASLWGGQQRYRVKTVPEYHIK